MENKLEGVYACLRTNDQGPQGTQDIPLSPSPAVGRFSRQPVSTEAQNSAEVGRGCPPPVNLLFG